MPVGGGCPVGVGASAVGAGTGDGSGRVVEGRTCAAVVRARGVAIPSEAAGLGACLQAAKIAAESSRLIRTIRGAFMVSGRFHFSGSSIRHRKRRVSLLQCVRSKASRKRHCTCDEAPAPLWSSRGSVGADP